MKKLALFLIRFYQKYLSFDSGFFHSIFHVRVCRFTPSCSEYAYQAIERYGILYGSWIGLKRIIRCGPWTKGGADPLPI
ncbi:membrane protein insertion efficiency factor YidD [Candidatus Gottesmanbacteria bacterium RIFOXYB1_FULL_47_11]|uniref:Putative membrane protein insertion efficiency factor n=1 Tax=Candidatus Gottesmanbacteria bacterium RIFOXYB1_FULL_47_11 TaxID=1798401 RepID=A0A1F6BCY0_9BACT|nr:MAG: membrane protein insertion efficiency factor YidD [Candidatus Gottesmanbacteria bacterium RIFOXYB1_FULL_47_11]